MSFMVCSYSHQAFYCTITRSFTQPPPKFEPRATAMPLELTHRWARQQHLSPLDFFSPFATGNDKKMKKKKIRVEFFSPLLPHVQSCSWALSYVGCRSVRWNTLASLLLLEVLTTCPPPLVFSFFCLHFMGHVCVDLTIASKRRWVRPTPPLSPLRFFLFLC
jgi:hypothetical protein